jgi:uncharacterized protein (TIGR02145 family)
MKKLCTCILVLISYLTLPAQDFYISFQPKSGTAPIDTVWVTNQSTNQKVRLTGSESLHLLKPTAVTSLFSDNGKGVLWPNPCVGEATLDFQTGITEMVSAGLFNATGQLLDIVKVKLSPGWHRFSIQFPAAGVYYLSIMKGSGNASFKAVSTGREGQNSRITCEAAGGSEVYMTSGKLKNGPTEKTMSFNPGDVLYHSAFSGKNNVIITDSPASTKVYVVEFLPCIDPDNQTYPVVKIGTQWWMAGNLRTTKYQDGTIIPNVADNSSWAIQTTGAYCWYNNNEAIHRNSYGALYNWYAAADSRKLCPAGWHVASDEEWKTMENYLIANGYNYDGKTTENNIGKSLATTTKWDTCTIYKGAVGNTDFPGYRNKTGFSALPGGGRAANGAFDIMGSWALWWTSTGFTTSEAWARFLGNTETSLDRFTDPKKVGYSVRCIGD